MSRILFLCSGNTCRSPMAAGIAARIFGGSHTVRSAGAETGSDQPAAANAIKVMAEEFQIDISGHRTVSVDDLNLVVFDIIVIFRPSAAERVSIPQTVYVTYLDVEDPYCGDLDRYRMAARLIERGVRRIYIEDGLRRVSSGELPPSSHLSGIFTRAAKECEQEVARFVHDELGQPVQPKATLGRLAESISEAKTQDTPMNLTDLSSAIATVNNVWVRVKHHSDPPAQDIVRGLTTLRRVFELLERKPAEGP